MIWYEPENPIVRNMERTGYPDGKEPVYPRCPVCGAECEEIYKDINFEIVGCDVCIRKADAWEAEECFPSEEEL